MKIYKTSTGGPVIVAIGTVLIFVIVLLNPTPVDVWVPWVYLSFLLFTIADMKYGIYAGTEKGEFFEIKHFIYRRKLKISDIDKIWYQPTWAAGDKMRSVYVIDGNGKAKFKLTNGGYAPQTLALLVNDLRNENKSITLDEPAKELVKKYLS